MRKPRHLSHGDRRATPDAVRWVDLRGANVGAAATDVFSFAFAQTIGGAKLRSELVAASEGDSDENVAGLAMGSGGALWTLVDAAHGGDRNVAVISRIGAAGCTESERLVNPAGRAERRLPRERAGRRRPRRSTSPCRISASCVHAFEPARPCAVSIRSAPL